MKPITAFIAAAYCILFTTYYSPPLAYAQTDWDGECIVGDVATIKGIGCLLQNVLTVFLQLLGLVFFIMLIIGGFKYLTAGGDPKAVESAKGTLTAAIGGIVLAILSWFILRLIQQITGVNVTEFIWTLTEP
jgi:uncharacterized membrane protein YvlD (DUF360 family)